MGRPEIAFEIVEDDHTDDEDPTNPGDPDESVKSFVEDKVGDGPVKLWFKRIFSRKRTGGTKDHYSIRAVTAGGSKRPPFGEHIEVVMG